MTPTHIPELNYILDGGFEKSVSVSVIYPKEFDSYALLSLMGTDTYNIVISFRDSLTNLETNLKRQRIPYKIDLFMDAISKSLGVSYEDDRVMFVDYPTLLNDISYEINRIFQRSENFNVLIYTGDGLLEYNEEQSARKFLEVVKNRTLNVGTFFHIGTKPILTKTEYELSIVKEEDYWIMKGKGLLSEVFFKLDPVFKVL